MTTGDSSWKFLLLVCALVTTTTLVQGCEYFPESTFTLATDSRLPKWAALPPGTTRTDVDLTMSYYIKPWGRQAVFSLQTDKHHLLRKVEGKVMCSDPFHLVKPTDGSTFAYPAYEAVTVSGTTEIIEHRKMEPVFYVTDDPAAWRRYKEIGCGK